MNQEEKCVCHFFIVGELILEKSMSSTFIPMYIYVDINSIMPYYIVTTFKGKYKLPQNRNFPIANSCCCLFKDRLSP